MTLTFELFSVKMNQCAKYLGDSSLNYCRGTEAHRHTLGRLLYLDD